jgi:hypothetical protein
MGRGLAGILVLAVLAGAAASCRRESADSAVVPAPAVEPSAGDLDARTSDEIATEILSEYPLWKDAPDAKDLADVVRSLGSEATRAKLDELLRGR